MPLSSLPPGSLHLVFQFVLPFCEPVEGHFLWGDLVFPFGVKPEIISSDAWSPSRAPVRLFHGMPSVSRDSSLLNASNACFVTPPDVLTSCLTPLPVDDLDCLLTWTQTVPGPSVFKLSILHPDLSFDRYL